MKAREVIRVLKSNGWYEVRVKGSHHQFANPEFSYVVTVPVHAGKDISIGVLRSIEVGTGLSFVR